MNTYCAGELIILGVIENTQGKHALQKQPQVHEFKVNQNIWLNIEVTAKSDSSGTPCLTLKDLIVCEYKYKVLPHFIFYPKLDATQLIAHKGVSLNELIDRSKTWDKKEPILPRHELSMTDDLTDNEILVRQINCAHILKRNL